VADLPSAAMKSPATARPVRGTQLLVEHMGHVVRRPSLVAIEVLWRWAVGVPLLWTGWYQWQKILAAYPLADSGFNSLDTQNPWVAAVQLVGVWSYYRPHVFAVLRWLVPLAAAAWVVASGLGRSILLMRLDPRVKSRLRFRPPAFIALQAAWMALLVLTFFGWYSAMRWTAYAHIAASGEPDLIGYFVWAIFLSLGFFTAFALISWAVSIAPLLMLFEERRSPVSALGQSFRLGKAFTGKLAEINLVMGIVKLALIVLAMVFSAAPLPFSDELGPGALHVVTAGAVLFYLVANDFFQVVRLRAFVEFWRIFRGQHIGEPAG
jgi:hypothetical protein